MAALTATDHIHDEVRELIRRRGIDPVADRRSTRLLIDEVVTHYEERVPTSSLVPCRPTLLSPTWHTGQITGPPGQAGALVTVGWRRQRGCLASGRAASRRSSSQEQLV